MKIVLNLIAILLVFSCTLAEDKCKENSECADDQGCKNGECVNVCESAKCGENASCRAKDHLVVCVCETGYEGNPLEKCSKKCEQSSDCSDNQGCKNSICRDLCEYNSCGKGAACSTKNHEVVCSCKEGQEGNPLEKCYVKCKENSDCSDDQGCKNGECSNICESEKCGENASCKVIKHSSLCVCEKGYEGNPFDKCTGVIKQCKENSECLLHQACKNDYCEDVCKSNSKQCGEDGECLVKDHAPICLCHDIPNAKCTPYNSEPKSEPKVDSSEECSQSTDCPSTHECKDKKCVDVCAETTKCGENTSCQGISHVPVCSCKDGFVGDAKVKCLEKRKCKESADCENFEACKDGFCRYLCDPSLCGEEASCFMKEHSPICECRKGFVGDPFMKCTVDKESETPLRENECDKCGPFSSCREVDGASVCSCHKGYLGNPPNCKPPECSESSHCLDNESCKDFFCINPCNLNVCGEQASCSVKNHSPKCTCNEGYSGDPFIKCAKQQPELPVEVIESTSSKETEVQFTSTDAPSKESETTISTDVSESETITSFKLSAESTKESETTTKASADESTEKIETTTATKSSECDSCGPFSTCDEKEGLTVCRCLISHVGAPPNCKPPECTTDSDCPIAEACLSQKCKDPCGVEKTCSENASCSVENHAPICKCKEGYTGDPYILCLLFDLPKDD